MFFGKIITQSAPYVYQESNEQETPGQVLSLTNVVLAPQSKENATLWIKNSKGQFLIASLTKERPHASLNIFLSLIDQFKLLVKGNGNLHVVGFFQQEQGGDFMNPQDFDDQQQQQQLDEEQIEEQLKNLKKPAVQGKAITPASNKPPAQKPQSPQQKPQASTQQKPQAPQQKSQSPQQKPQSPQQKPQNPANNKPIAPKVVADKDEESDEQQFVQVDEQGQQIQDDDDQDMQDQDDDQDIDDQQQDEDDSDIDIDDDIGAAPKKQVKPNNPQGGFFGGKPNVNKQPQPQQNKQFNNNQKPNNNNNQRPNFHQNQNKPNNFHGKPNHQGGKPHFNNNKPNNFNKGGNQGGFNKNHHNNNKNKFKHGGKH